MKKSKLLAVIYLIFTCVILTFTCTACGKKQDIKFDCDNSITLSVGETIRVTVIYENGEVCKDVQFWASHTNIVTVDETGLITAKNIGLSNVGAVSKGGSTARPLVIYVMDQSSEQ